MVKTAVDTYLGELPLSLAVSFPFFCSFWKQVIVWFVEQKAEPEREKRLQLQIAIQLDWLEARVRVKKGAENRVNVF